jgi:hypothetical protein
MTLMPMSMAGMDPLDAMDEMLRNMNIQPVHQKYQQQQHHQYLGMYHSSY